MNDVSPVVLVLVAIITSGGFSAITIRFLDRKHTSAKTADVLVGAGEKAVGILERQLDSALERISMLEQENAKRAMKIAELEMMVAELKAQLRENGS